MMSGKNQIQLAQQQWRLVFCGTEGRPQWKKKRFLSGIARITYPPPPLPQFGQLGPFFRKSKFKI